MTPGSDPSAPGTTEGEATTALGGIAGEPDASTRLPRDTHVGRYVVVDFVGSGGMGMVYSAFDPELDRKVAIKLLRPDARGGNMARARDRLLREAQSMARLSHPNVLPVFDVGTFEDSVFIAVELVEGGTLRAWLLQEKPSWRRIVEVFGEAARGLAAAHAEGLVHRDFKPENVMLSRGGAVRVMDFGLARPAPDTESAAITHTHARVIAEGGSLTRTGFVMGTPAYMAPEQHESMAVDHRADQFAFCVALYEALYRERPFAGRTADELVAAVLAQQVRPAPASSDVPGWLRRVVLRGLAADPRERWPDMNALSSALAHDRGARWRGVGILAAGTGLAVAIGVAYGRQGEPPCAGFDQPFAGWTDARKQELHDAFVASNVAYASDTWMRIVPLVDAHAAAWSAARSSACAATRVRGEQSEAAFDAQLDCLALRHAQLDGLLAMFAAPDAGVVEHAVDSVAGLDAIDRCLTADPSAEHLPPPEHRERIEAVRTELARASAQRSAAHFDAALAIVRAVVPIADEIGWAPLRAEVGLLEGQLRGDLGEIEAGARAVEAAAELAESVGMDELAARGYASLVSIVGVHGAQSEAGERWAKLASAKLQRVGTLPRVEAQLAMWRASMADTAGDYPAARRWTEEAVAAWERADPGGPDHAIAIGNLGRVFYRQADARAALAAFERAHAVAVESLGPQHPEVAKLLSNMAACQTKLGDLDASQRLLEQALAVLETALPADHPDIAITMTNLAALAYRQQRYQEAIDISRRVIAIRKRALGPGSTKIAASLNNLALSLMSLKRYDEAFAAYREAVDIYDAAHPEGHPEEPLMLTGLGEIELLRGHPERAIPALARAEKIAMATGGDPYALAETRFLWARASWETGERARARELAEQAAAVLREAPEGERRHLAEIERWLTEHTVP